MSNFGVGLGAFMTGVTQGAQAMQSIKRGNKQDEILDMQIADLKQNRADKQAIQDISTTGVQEAQQNTDGGVQNVMNYYMKNTVPKIQQQYLANGDVQKADAFGKWVQDKNVQEGMRYSANMIRAAHQNDPQGVMDNMVKLYNQPGYFEDGMSAVSASLTKDDKGNPNGMAIVVKNDKTGEERTHTFNSMKDVYDTVFQFGQPDQVFKYATDQIAAGQKVSSEMAKEDRDWQRKLTEKTIDQTNRLEQDNNQSQLRTAEEAAKARNPNANKKVQDAQATIAFLKQNGASDEYIRSNLAGIVGIENRSRPMSSRIDDYVKMRTESDRDFRKKSQDEQIAEARSYIANVDKQSGDNTEVLSVPGATPTTTQQNSGVPFFDTKTGQIVTR